MKPSRNPSWRVVIQRLARAIDAFPRPPPGGMTWSSRSVSSLPMSDANDPVFARTQPARSTTPDRSTTPGSSAPSASDSAGTMRAMAAAYAGSDARSSAWLSAPGAFSRRAMAVRSTVGQSTRPRRAERSARRPATVAATPRADPIRNPACQTLSSRRAPRPPIRSVIPLALQDRSAPRPGTRTRTGYWSARGRLRDPRSSAAGESR